MISKSLESIEENIRLIPDVPVKKFVDKGKEAMLVLSEGTSRKQSCAEEHMECVQALNPKGSIEENVIPVLEISVGEHINKEINDLDERMQNGEEIEILSLRKDLHH